MYLVLRDGRLFAWLEGFLLFQTLERQKRVSELLEMEEKGKGRGTVQKHVSPGSQKTAR